MLYEDLGNMKNDSLGLHVAGISQCLRDANLIRYVESVVGFIPSDWLK